MSNVSETDFQALEELQRLRDSGVPIEWHMHDVDLWMITVLGRPLPSMATSQVHAFVYGADAGLKALTA